MLQNAFQYLPVAPSTAAVCVPEQGAVPQGYSGSAHTPHVHTFAHIYVTQHCSLLHVFFCPSTAAPILAWPRPCAGAAASSAGGICPFLQPCKAGKFVF